MAGLAGNACVSVVGFFLVMWGMALAAIFDRLRPMLKIGALGMTGKTVHCGMCCRRESGFIKQWRQVPQDLCLVTLVSVAVETERFNLRLPLDCICVEVAVTDHAGFVF